MSAVKSLTPAHIRKELDKLFELSISKENISACIKIIELQTRLLKFFSNQHNSPLSIHTMTEEDLKGLLEKIN